MGRLTTRRGRLLQPQLDTAGYLRVALGRHVYRRLHNLVLLAFVGPRPDGMEEIRHLNGIRTDNRLENLVYGTRSENQLDTVRHGRNQNSNKTHCCRGHELSGANLYIRLGTGQRACRKCKAIRRAERAKRLKAAQSCCI